MLTDAQLLRVVAESWRIDNPGSTTPERLRAIADRIDERPAMKRRRESPRE